MCTRRKINKVRIKKKMKERLNNLIKEDKGFTNGKKTFIDKNGIRWYPKDMLKAKKSDLPF